MTARRAFKHLPFFSVALIGACLAGCSTNTLGQQEWGFRFGTEVTIFTRAASTAEEASQATVTLDDRIMGPPAPPTP